jgi:hypothetical protein
VTKGSIFYRLKTDPITVLLAITLLAYGCPVQAIIVAFGFDERTVREWWRAGRHCQAVHEQLVGGSQLDLQQVQADEIKVKTQGGVISPHRDQSLIQSLAHQIRAIALRR